MRRRRWFPISRGPHAITSPPSSTWKAYTANWSIPAASRNSPRPNWPAQRRPFRTSNTARPTWTFSASIRPGAVPSFLRLFPAPSHRSTRAETILILTKTDLPRNATGGAVWQKLSSTCPPLETSSRSGAGLDALRARLRQAILARRAGEGEVVAGTAARCRQSLALAAEGLARARACVRSGRRGTRRGRGPHCPGGDRQGGWGGLHG